MSLSEYRTKPLQYFKNECNNKNHVVVSTGTTGKTKAVDSVVRVGAAVEARRNTDDGRGSAGLGLSDSGEVVK